MARYEASSLCTNYNAQDVTHDTTNIKMNSRISTFVNEEYGCVTVVFPRKISFGSEFSVTYSYISKPNFGPFDALEPETCVLSTYCSRFCRPGRLKMTFSLLNLFLEPYRERHRKATKRGLLCDIFFHSGIYDYRLLRILYNLPIGFGLCFGLYMFAWARLNFAYFDETLSEVFKWTLVGSCTLAFALSPVFRCALICTCLGALGGNGQALLSVFVLEQVQVGPINNTITNFKSTANMIVCHLDVQKKLMNQKAELLAGNFTRKVEKEFGKSIEQSKEVVGTVRSSFQPFMEHFDVDNDEERRLERVLANARARRERAQVVQGLDSSKAGTEKENAVDETIELPFWAQFKSKVARTTARRMEQQCQEIIVNSLGECERTFTKLQRECEAKVNWFVNYWFPDVCESLSPIYACKHDQISKKITEACRKPLTEGQGKDAFLTPDFDEELNGFQNMTTDVEKQFKLNMHYQMIEEPRIEDLQRLSDVKVNLEARVTIYQSILKTLKEFISSALIYFIYTMFRDCVNMLTNYLNNIDFKNTYMTRYFYYIDEKRKIEGKQPLLPLTKAEIKKHNLMSPFSPPTRPEIEACWFPLLKWFIVTLISLIILAVDHFFYKVINLGERKFNLTIAGNGLFGDLMRNLLNQESDTSMDTDISSDDCVKSNAVGQLDSEFIVRWIFLPLLAMLVLQVVFGFIIKRVTMFYVVDFIFKRRSKARTIQLYNKILFARLEQRKKDRTRIRRAVRRHALREAQGSVLSRFPLLASIADKLLKTGKCLMCLERAKKATLVNCPQEHCVATYCRKCWIENNEECYGCLAERGVVDDKKTHVVVLQPKPAIVTAETPTKKEKEDAKGFV
uniref:DC_STAMP domain-containing protein n=1 Tax=Steinernema glaseri TaxID=37863 RepID=A0A1I8A7C8_9BILA